MVSYLEMKTAQKTDVSESTSSIVHEQHFFLFQSLALINIKNITEFSSTLHMLYGVQHFMYSNKNKTRQTTDTHTHMV